MREQGTHIETRPWEPPKKVQRYLMTSIRAATGSATARHPRGTKTVSNRSLRTHPSPRPCVHRLGSQRRPLAAKN